MATRRAQETPTRTRSLPVVESVELSIFDTGNDVESIQRRPTACPDPWYPKLTLYRLLVLVATVGLGAAKAVTSYLNFNYASITLEWILGVVVFLFFHLLGSYEERDTRRLEWLFHVDHLKYIWNLLAIFEIHRPSYRSDELNDSHWNSTATMPRHPPITGYRILVTVLVLFFGMLKSAFWYGNHQNEVTTIECVFGVGIVTYLYWLGLYETSSTKIYPALFHVDYSDKVSYGLLICLLIGSMIGKIAVYLVALTICGAATVIFYYLSTMFYDFRWSASMFPQFPIVALWTSLVTEVILVTMWLSAAASTIVVFFFLLWMLARSPVGRHISRQPGPREVVSFVYSVYQDYWLPPTSRQRRNHSFYVKRVMIRQIIKLPTNVVITYVVSIIPLVLLWPVFMIVATLATMLELLIPVTFTFPLLCFLFISPTLWVSSILIRDFYSGFLNFLVDVRNDYTEEGPSIPLTSSE